MWSSIEEKIANFSQLSAEEQQEVELYVSNHPEMKPILEEAKAWGRLLKEGRLLHTDPTSDEALAYYITTRRSTAHPVPAHLQIIFDRIEERLAQDPAAQARYQELARRIAALEASSDPLEQFERLSGHRISPSTSPPVASSPDIQDHQQDRKPVLLRPSFAFRLAIAAAVIGTLLVGALGLVHLFSQSELVQLAALDAIAAQGPVRLRSETASPDSLEGHYQQALASLSRARSATLGLFTRYDPERLEEAATLLQDLIAQASPDSPLRAQAYYVLGRIRLAQEDVPGATEALQAVLDGSGWRAAEAKALLDQIEALSN
jgi:hypothetical protein